MSAPPLTHTAAIDPAGSAATRAAAVAGARRIVVKIGTGVLTAPGGGFATRVLRAVARDAAALTRAGREVVVVSSGAIGLGTARLATTASWPQAFSAATSPSRNAVCASCQ